MTRQKQSKPKLSPHSTPANDSKMISEGWWYEDEKGIYVLSNGIGETGQAMPWTPQVRIQWKHLLAAAKRCGALK